MTRCLPCLLMLAAAFGVRAAEDAPAAAWRRVPVGNNYAVALLADEKGGFWCGVEGDGLYHHDGLWTRRVEVPLANEYPRALLAHKQGLCVGFARSGFGFRRADGQWQIHGLAEGFGAHRVNDLAWLDDGSIAAATERGLWRFTGKSWRYGGLLDPAGLLCLNVNDKKLVAGSAVAGLWLGPADSHLQRVPPPVEQGVAAVLLDGGDTLWAGTKAGLVCRRADGARQVLAPPQRPRSASEQQYPMTPRSPAVTALARAPTGGFFVGTRSEGIWHYAVDEGEWTSVDTPGDPTIWCTALALATDGSLLAASYGQGVAVREPPAWDFHTSHGVLHYENGTARLADKWRYESRTKPDNPEEPPIRRRLRRVQQIGGDLLLLYFAGPAAGSTGAEDLARVAATVLIEAASGNVVWHSPGLPAEPLRQAGDLAIPAGGWCSRTAAGRK